MSSKTSPPPPTPPILSHPTPRRGRYCLSCSSPGAVWSFNLAACLDYCAMLDPGIVYLCYSVYSNWIHIWSVCIPAPPSSKPSIARSRLSVCLSDFERLVKLDLTGFSESHEMFLIDFVYIRYIVYKYRQCYECMIMRNKETNKSPKISWKMC